MFSSFRVTKPTDDINCNGFGLMIVMQIPVMMLLLKPMCIILPNMWCSGGGGGVIERNTGERGFNERCSISIEVLGGI